MDMFGFIVITLNEVVIKMKKNIAIILSLLLFSGCSQPAAEVSSSPTADVTATSTIEISSEATSTPEATQNSPTPITNTPLPTPFFDFKSEAKRS